MHCYDSNLKRGTLNRDLRFGKEGYSNYLNGEMEKSIKEKKEVTVRLLSFISKSVIKRDKKVHG